MSLTRKRSTRAQMKKLFAAILAAAFMAACSSEPSKPTMAQPTQPKAPETITGSGAFFKCYISARSWQLDAQAYRVESASSTSHDGKSEEWRVAFASPAHHSSKAFTWSKGDIAQGVDDTYSSTNSSTQIFNVQFLKSDTDKAFATAQQHGGDKLLEKDPDTPIQYVLEWNRQENSLQWHIIYGADRTTAKLRVAVDASTGDFVRIEK
jgi:hypothetical protein